MFILILLVQLVINQNHIKDQFNHLIVNLCFARYSLNLMLIIQNHLNFTVNHFLIQHQFQLMLKFKYYPLIPFSFLIHLNLVQHLRDYLVVLHIQPR